MFMSMLMSVVFILYICHLFTSYQARKKPLSCCMKDLWGQRYGWGTSTSYILSTPCNNIIFIFIVINSFNTLVTYCHYIHSGRNIDEVMLFFRKHERTLRSLKVLISNKKKSQISYNVNLSFALHVYDYEHVNVCFLHFVYVSSGFIISS